MLKNENFPAVYITGAGPGDPNLLTLKAKEIIKQATAIVYDTLVSKEVLDLANHINPEAEYIYAGKIAYIDDKSKCQEEIHKLLFDLSKKHKIICRLKGGDPSVFGRLGEEAEFLSKNKIVFEIIPGVSSITAVSSYAGIPLTHRDCNSSFTVLTAHEDPDSLTSSINWESFDAKNNTLILLMGTKNLPKIVNKLLSLDRDPKTPIAIVYKGTTSAQVTYTSNLESVISEIRNENVTHPALIIIGKVVEYRKILNWFESKTLFKKRILIPRSNDNAVSFSEKLIKMGANPIICPIVEYKAIQEEIYNKKFVNNISEYDWIFFTSQNSVKYFFDILKKNFYDSRALFKNKIATVGFKTKLEVEKYNINVDFVPKRFSFENLVSELSEVTNLEKSKILYPTQEGNKRNFKLDNVTRWDIYKADFFETLDEEIIQNIKSGIDVITFFSANTALHFSSLVKKYNLSNYVSNSTFAVIGNETATTVKSLFGRVDIIAEPSHEDGLILNTENYFSKNLKLPAGDRL